MTESSLSVSKFHTGKSVYNKNGFHLGDLLVTMTSTYFPITINTFLYDYPNYTYAQYYGFEEFRTCHALLLNSYNQNSPKMLSMYEELFETLL